MSSRPSSEHAGDAVGRPRPASLVAAAVLVTTVPAGVLAWQATTLLALAVPALPSAAVVLTATVVAAVGAAIGVRRTPPAEVGLIRASAQRTMRLVALAVAAAAVVAAAAGGATPVGGRLTAVVLVVLVVAFAGGQGVGDAYRRQVRTTATAAQRHDADRSLPFRVLVATAASLVLGVLGELAEAAPGGPAVARWLPLMVLVAGVAGVAAARHLVLRARSDRTAGALAPAWWRGTVRIGLVVVAVAAVGGVLLLAGGERWLADALPDPPGWPETSLAADREPSAAAAEQPPSAPPPLWQVLTVVALVVVALVATRGPRRRRAAPGRPGQRMSLWMLIRSVLTMLRPEADERVGEETPVEPPAPRSREEAVLPSPLRHLVARLRPRPREPAAAILHDYRAVQRHLDRGARRQAAETPLRHAGRLAIDDLRELASLVCTSRYTTHQATEADAARSRELARRLVRR